MRAVLDHSTPEGEDPLEPSSRSVESNLEDEERGLTAPIRQASHSSRQSPSPEVVVEETELQTVPNPPSFGGYIKKATSQVWDAMSTSSRKREREGTITPKLAALVDAYRTSDIAADIKLETEEIARAQTGPPVISVEQTEDGVVLTAESNGELRDVAVESNLLRGRKRATWTTQFTILSGRAFKNLYRDPALLTAHYTSSVALACKSFPSNHLARLPE